MTRSIKNRRNKTIKKNKGGACACGKNFFSGGGGSGGNMQLIGPSATVIIPATSAPELGNLALDPSRYPVSGRNNFGGRNSRRKRKLKKVYFVNAKKNTKKKGGSMLANAYDMILGPSSALNTITSVGTTSGTVYATNTMYGNVPTSNALAFSQPINNKFNDFNRPMV